MEQKTTAKLTKGIWNSLPTAEEAKLFSQKERLPKVAFEVGKSVKINFAPEFTMPIELGNEIDGFYYLFDCFENQENKVIMTSAWTLLRGLKLFYPLSNKSFSITKMMDKGKQHFVVEEVK